MTPSVALLCLALLPQAAPPETPSVVDVVELARGGGVIEGTIIESTKDYVEIRLGPGNVVGFERSRIARITQRQATAAAPRAETPVQPRDEWFVLHDATGRAVGRLHSTVTHDGAQLRLGEEWEFPGERETTAITVLEVVGADLRPVSSFYHERRQRNVDGKTVHERLVRGTVEDDRFVVATETLLESDRVAYPLDPELRFPLASRAAHQLRRPAGVPVQRRLFDAGRQEFIRRGFSTGGRRRVQWQGQQIEVEELRYEVDGGINCEWLDASYRTIRREINGPSLVAVPMQADAIERHLMALEPSFPAAVAAAPNGQFALWLPNPSWQLDQAAVGRGVTASHPLRDASACLLSFEQLDSDLLLDSAADTVLRWLRAAKRGLQIRGRERVKVRDREAVRFEAIYPERRSGRRREIRCEVYVFAAHGQHMALCFDAPEQDFEDLRADFARMLDSVDLHPPAVLARRKPGR